MTLIKCYCDSQMSFDKCCKPYINSSQKAPTALALMRSRYSAFATHQASYLIATTHISTRKDHSVEDVLDWATSNQWLKLEIINSTQDTVEFKAHYKDTKAQRHIHHELSTFIFENESWFYCDGTFS